MEQLSSVSNDKIKLAVGVRDSARTRREKGLFFLEGARLCADAAANGIALAAVFVTSEALEKYDDYLGAALEISRSSYVISPKVAEKLSDTRNTQGVFALCDAVENRSGAAVSGIALGVASGAPSPEDLVFIPGDVDLDGDIDTADVRLLMKHRIGATALSQKQLTAADINGDGRADSQDVRQILWRLSKA